MKIHPAAQGTLEWLVARSAIPTASEFDNLLTPEFAIRKGEMPKTYLARKVAEAWLGGPLPGFQSLDMDFGKILEDEALPFFELETGQKVKRVGLITTDDGLIGCSPDGLIGEDSGIEVKCPEPHQHCRYLLGGEVPKDYLAQVHGAMFVTGRPTWVFLSYRRRFPPLIVTVRRDEKIQEAICDALALFLGQFQAAMKKMEEINSGPPYRPTPAQPPKAPEFSDVYA